MEAARGSILSRGKFPAARHGQTGFAEGEGNGGAIGGVNLFTGEVCGLSAYQALASISHSKENKKEWHNQQQPTGNANKDARRWCCNPNVARTSSEAAHRLCKPNARQRQNDKRKDLEASFAAAGRECSDN